MPSDGKIEFHLQAAKRFNQLAEEILRHITSHANAQPATTPKSEIHPVAQFSSADIIGEISVEENVVNGLGEEVGRFWTSNGLQVGWLGAGFELIKGLASRFEKASAIKGRVSHEFLVNQTFEWLRETLEQKRGDMLTDHIAERCSTEIKDFEIWIPVYRTYSTRDFNIGEVTFRTVSKAILDAWYGSMLEEDGKHPGVAVAINRERASIQGSLAACVRINAEMGKAKEVAHGIANDMIGLLRFLSPVNWTCKLVSHCLPVAKDNTLTVKELFVENGAIVRSSKASVEQGPPGWNIDQARQQWPGILEALHDLASRRAETDFRGDFYTALQLHSRHSVAVEVPHKILFVTAAIESLLLKDPREPIQKNLGERMAFLIGKTLQQRKEIVKNVNDFYDIRSNFFHHGEEVRPEDEDVVDKFFLNVWICFTRLLADAAQYTKRKDLLDELENRKLS